MSIRLKRAYDKPEPDDGFRILVDRLWPRGVSKSTARYDLGLKEITRHAHSADYSFLLGKDAQAGRTKMEENTMGTDKETIKLAIKDEFLGRFKKTDAKPGDTLSVTWLYDEFLPGLSKKEQSALEEAILEMIHDGLIEYVHTPKTTYALTQKGKDLLC